MYPWLKLMLLWMGKGVKDHLIPKREYCNILSRHVIFLLSLGNMIKGKVWPPRHAISNNHFWKYHCTFCSKLRFSVVVRGTSHQSSCKSIVALLDSWHIFHSLLFWSLSTDLLIFGTETVLGHDKKLSCYLLRCSFVGFVVSSEPLLFCWSYPLFILSFFTNSIACPFRIGKTRVPWKWNPLGGSVETDQNRSLQLHVGLLWDT